MRIGFYTNYTEETAAFAQEVGFTSLQLSAWPGSSLDANTITDARIDAILKDLDARNITISALGYYPNYLSADEHEREESQAYFPKVLALAERMGVGMAATFVGQDSRYNVEENMPGFKELFSRFCDDAHKRNVKIAIENCPMIKVDTMKGNNIAYSPEVWDVMFDLVPSSNLGLEFDPSHLVWQGIDYVQAIKDYAPKIFHVHAKDLEVDHKLLKRSGILGRNFAPKKGLDRRWWRARTPGWGDVDWPKF